MNTRRHYCNFCGSKKREHKCEHCKPKQILVRPEKLIKIPEEKRNGN